ncbi:hypothetical protein CXF72_01805 [Psychromonas sp. MB-3u-54]|uniref:glycosyltransferase family 4 protein n=1 Tax=Psychromonas sp. MB-3u-54 TaxID=2058319 RepID=UPI000C32FB18|nr:glycosyltransferase family 4 protein [Psychromonas sp. MB-3u-54]PKH04233.1 hypothetical protein CXF72_01805 [Psychromonas sp. MB-3u-54]
MFKKTVMLIKSKLVREPRRDYSSARLKMKAIVYKKNYPGLIKFVLKLTDQGYSDASLCKYAFGLTKDINFDTSVYFAERVLNREIDPNFATVYITRLKRNNDLIRAKEVITLVKQYETLENGYVSQKKKLIDTYEKSGAETLISSFNNKVIKKEQVRIGLAKIVFSLLKDEETELALEFIEPFINITNDPSFLNVVQNRYIKIGQTKKAKIIAGIANRSQTVSTFRTGLKNLIDLNDDTITNIKSYVVLSENNVDGLLLFNKTVFSLLKDLMPSFAIEYGIKYAQHNNNIDESFNLILALRLSRLKMNYEAYNIYSELYAINKSAEVKSKLINEFVKIHEVKIKNIFLTSVDVTVEINNLLPKELQGDSLVVSQIIFESCKNNDELIELAILHANAVLALGEDAYISLALSNLYFKLGDISSAINVKGFNENNTKHSLKLSHYQAYKNLLENGLPLPIKMPLANKNTNVLYCLHNTLPYHSGGYATRSHGLAKGISNNDWNIQIASRLGYPHDLSSHKKVGMDIPKMDMVDGLNYHRLFTDINHYGVANLQDYIENYAKELTELACELNVSIIHGASNFMNGIAANYAARNLGIKSVYEVRGLWEITRMSRQPDWEGSEHFNMIRRLETEAAMNADAVLTITHALKDEMVARGVNENKITVVSNGVHVDRFVPKARVAELEQELGYQDKIVIGFIGSVVSYEGLEHLVQATSLLKERGLDNFVVMIVGDGAVLDNIKALVNDLNVADYFTFTGRVPHEVVEDYYSLVDIAPFPRIGVPVCEMVSPLKPFEAMSMGKAVISSNVAALTEIVNDGVTGLTFEKDNAISFANTLQKLIDDPALRKELGDNARNWVVAEKDWSMLANKISRVYERLINE